MSKTHRFRVLGLLGLPLLAVAVAVLVLAWGAGGATTQAANTDESVGPSVGRVAAWNLST